MKMFYGVLALLVVAVSANASVNAPKDNNGQTLPTIDWVGAQPCTIYSSNATLCFSGRGAIYGVVVASDTIVNYAVFRDSNTANTSSSSFTAVTGNYSGVALGGTMQLIKFPVPVQVSNGLSVNLNAAPLGGGSWMILYRKLAATE